MIRIFLVMAVFLVFTIRGQSQYNFNENCRNAYQEILCLRFEQAGFYIAKEKLEYPENLIPVYLENLVDFLTLVIGENHSDYERLKAAKSTRVKRLETGRKDDPYHNFCLGEIHLQWAIARLKFGDYVMAAMEIQKAHDRFSENEKHYPDFLINKMGLGVVQVMISLVPDNYRWISNMIGLRGSMQQGISGIRQVATYHGEDRTTRMFRPHASFLLAFLTLNLQSDKKDALTIMPYLSETFNRDLNPGSPLLIYAKVSVLMRNGMNDEALDVLGERQRIGTSYPFRYLDYLEGMARLNKLDFTAFHCFEAFTKNFQGRNYLQSAYQKMAWIMLLKGDSANYNRLINSSGTLGAAVIDEDKQVGTEAQYALIPNVILLRARLFSDGGYYNLALDELLNNSVRAMLKSKRDLVEYNYRLGRIYHETGNSAKAIERYRQTITQGKSEPYYFAAGAALQLGLLYENNGSFQKADSAYNLCLSINPREYKTSLHQKAKAGLNRLKTHHPKT